MAVTNFTPANHKPLCSVNCTFGRGASIRYFTFGVLTTLVVCYLTVLFVLLDADKRLDPIDGFVTEHYEQYHIPYPRIWKRNIVIDESLLEAKGDTPENIRSIGLRLAREMSQSQTKRQNESNSVSSVDVSGETPVVQRPDMSGTNLSSKITDVSAQQQAIERIQTQVGSARRSEDGRRLTDLIQKVNTLSTKRRNNQLSGSNEITGLNTQNEGYIDFDRGKGDTENGQDNIQNRLHSELADDHHFLAKHARRPKYKDRLPVGEKLYNRQIERLLKQQTIRDFLMRLALNNDQEFRRKFVDEEFRKNENFHSGTGNQQNDDMEEDPNEHFKKYGMFDTSHQNEDQDTTNGENLNQNQIYENPNLQPEIGDEIPQREAQGLLAQLMQNRPSADNNDLAGNRFIEDLLITKADERVAPVHESKNSEELEAYLRQLLKDQLTQIEA